MKFVDDFPMTVTGKVQKFKMRQAAIEKLGLGEEAAIATAEPPGRSASAPGRSAHAGALARCYTSSQPKNDPLQHRRDNLHATAWATAWQSSCAESAICADCS